MEGNINGGLREDYISNESIAAYMNLLKNHTKDISEIIWKKKFQDIAENEVK